MSFSSCVATSAGFHGIFQPILSLAVTSITVAVGFASFVLTLLYVLLPRGSSSEGDLLYSTSLPVKLMDTVRFLPCTPLVPVWVPMPFPLLFVCPLSWSHGHPAVQLGIGVCAMKLALAFLLVGIRGFLPLLHEIFV